MAYVVRNRRNREVVLLNPAEKGKKAAFEIKSGRKITNASFLDGKAIVKRNKYGKPLRLTDNERAYRAGYLAARSDSAKAYNSQRRSRGRYIPIVR